MHRKMHRRSREPNTRATDSAFDWIEAITESAREVRARSAPSKHRFGTPLGLKKTMFQHAKSQHSAAMGGALRRQQRGTKERIAQHEG
jgi:hypothetical protein